jgi:hypothetical protein
MFSIIALAILTAVNAGPAITSCSKATALFKIDALGFWPDPAVRNENSTISFLYTVPEPGITGIGATAVYTVTYNFIPLTPTIEDLCKNIACPILPGTYNLSTSSTFPDVSGSLVSKIEWKNQDGAQLLCASIKTNT